MKSKHPTLDALVVHLLPKGESIPVTTVIRTGGVGNSLYVAADGKLYHGNTYIEVLRGRDLWDAELRALVRLGILPKAELAAVKREGDEVTRKVRAIEDLTSLSQICRSYGFEPPAAVLSKIRPEKWRELEAQPEPSFQDKVDHANTIFSESSAASVH